MSTATLDPPSANGTHDAPQKVPSKNALLTEIISQEMTPDGKVDHDRIIAIGRARVASFPEGQRYDFKKRETTQVASRIRVQRGLHDKQLSESMRKYPAGHAKKPAPDYRAANAAKARESKAAKAKLHKSAAAFVEAVAPSFNQMQLLSARSFLASCGNNADTASACLKLVQSLSL